MKILGWKAIFYNDLVVDADSYKAVDFNAVVEWVADMLERHPRGHYSFIPVFDYMEDEK